ncbi:response regulator transcription factor [Alkaliflexus imshenetskii]|uniref:response regulator transcription factor n=1 Tax=Alkaliflexus imshenetskii TaxID=286730 RepID=UPI00047B7DB7|nr:response regulator transcription factor [Alkaliflexus imshenetskii]
MKILIIEDDNRLASLLLRALHENGYEADVAYDGQMGQKLALNNDYKLVITDIILPKKDGLEVCKEIRRQKSSLPIIMLTALGTTDDKVEGFDAGADDYLVKPFEMRELLARVKVLLNRYANLNSNTASTLIYSDLELNLNTKTVVRNNQSIHLTPKEFKLLEFMMRNSERVLSRTEIAEKVWETHFDTGTNFIDVYINYLRKKIDKGFDTKLIHTKSGMGFILLNDESEA